MQSDLIKLQKGVRWVRPNWPEIGGFSRVKVSFQ